MFQNTKTNFGCPKDVICWVVGCVCVAVFEFLFLVLVGFLATIGSLGLVEFAFALVHFLPFGCCSSLVCACWRVAVAFRLWRCSFLSYWMIRRAIRKWLNGPKASRLSPPLTSGILSLTLSKFYCRYWSTSDKNIAHYMETLVVIKFCILISGRIYILKEECGQ